MLNLSRNKLQRCKLQQHVAQSRTEFYFLQHFFQLATMKFVARQVEQTVVIRATTRSNCSATMLRDKLNKNVARITGPLFSFLANHYCECRFEVAVNHLRLLSWNRRCKTRLYQSDVKSQEYPKRPNVRNVCTFKICFP